MESREEERVGLLIVAAGLATVVVAVLLFGVTTDGVADWVSIVTAIAGVLMAAAGLYIASRRNRRSGTPHAAS